MEIEQITLMISQNVNKKHIQNMCLKWLEMLFHGLKLKTNPINRNRKQIQIKKGEDVNSNLFGIKFQEWKKKN